MQNRRRARQRQATYWLTAPQKKIAKSNARFKVVRAGRRFGKTIYSLLEIKARLLFTDNCKIAYVAPTKSQGKSIAWEEAHAIFGKFGEGGMITSSNGEEGAITVLNSYGGSSTLCFYGWNRKEYEKARGQKFHHVYLDEVAQFSEFFHGWRSVWRATLMDYKGGATFISTPRGFNHFYKICTTGFSEEKSANTEAFHFTSYDNDNISREEIDELAEELGPDLYSQEILAEFTKQQGLVYQEFSRERHILDKMPDWAMSPSVKKYVGVDWGFKDPVAMPIILTDGIRYLVMDEVYESQMTHRETADVAVAIRDVEQYFIEPAEPALVKEIGMRGVRVSKPKEIDKSITRGVSIIRDMIRADKFFVMKNCENTLIELDMYGIDDKTGEPKDADNHLMDAIRYVIVPLEDRKATMQQFNTGKSNILVIKTKNRI